MNITIRWLTENGEESTTVDVPYTSGMKIEVDGKVVYGLTRFCSDDDTRSLAELLQKAREKMSPDDWMRL